MVESPFDVVTLVGSVVDVCINPTDPWAWAGFVGDAIDLIPCVTGVGEAIKGMRGVAKLADAVDDGADVITGATKAANKFDITDFAGYFVAGTLVKTEDGSVNIEDIEEGDLVYAKDTDTGVTGYKKVVQIFRVEATELIHLQAGDVRIDTTPEHPFWVEGYGFKKAGELAEGDYVETAEGKLLLVKKTTREYLTEPVIVYNFEVEDWHTYYVSEDEILVHNTCMVTKSGKETELFLPDEFYNKNLPSQVTPGTKYLPKYDEVGNVKQIKMYDDYGRESGWVDYTNHAFGNVNSPHYHTTPHWHEKIYNAQYPDGMKIHHRTDINTPLGAK